MNLDVAQYIDMKYFGDGRGYFTETLNISKEPFNQVQYVQSNMSCNKMGVLRGMHYQVTKPQGKLCQVLSGSACDFVIDLRESSPSFKKVTTFYLEAKGKAVWVPPGYAHGFFAMEEDTLFSYHVFGNSWDKDDECSINPFSVVEVSKVVSSYLTVQSVLTSPKDVDGYDFTEQKYPTYK